MATLRPPIAALRNLSEHGKVALFAQLDAGERRLSAEKVRRHSDILRRHVLGSETRAALCREFGISPQQFFADRRSALRRASAALDISESGQPLQAEYRTMNAHVAQATALYEAGASTDAAKLLDALGDTTLHGEPWLESVALSLEIGADTGRDRSAIAAQRLHAYRETATQAERPYADAAIALRATYAAVAAGDRAGFGQRFAQAVAALRSCAANDRRAQIVLARWLVTMAPSLLELESRDRALAAIDEALQIAGERDDVPVAIRALAHANRACVCSSSVDLLSRAGPAREKATELALGNALPRTMWVCLYLSVFENIWLGDPGAALEDARALFTSVEASQSGAWRRIARSRLSNAYSAVNRLDAAERAIAPLGGPDPNDAAFALQSCALAYRRKNFGGVLRQAALLSARFASQSPIYHANALLYSAGAAHALRDPGRARTDIGDAVSIFEKSSTPTLFIALQSFKLAHRITGRSRYRDAAHDLQSAFEKLEPIHHARAAKHELTPRQREIVRLALSGATNAHIAAALGISARTVGNHLAAVYAALGIRARWQLANVDIER